MKTKHFALLSIPRRAQSDANEELTGYYTQLMAAIIQMMPIIFSIIAEKNPAPGQA